MGTPSICDSLSISQKASKSGGLSKGALSRLPGERDLRCPPPYPPPALRPRRYMSPCRRGRRMLFYNLIPKGGSRPPLTTPLLLGRPSPSSLAAMTPSRLPARALVAGGDRSAPTEAGAETGRWTRPTGAQRPPLELDYIIVSPSHAGRLSSFAW